MLKALSAYRCYLSRKHKGKKASLPRFKKIIPVMVRQDQYSLHQLPSGTWVIKFPISSGRGKSIAVPLAASAYHVKRLQDLVGGSCRQGSMEIWCNRSGEWYVAIPLVYETRLYEPSGVIGVDLGIVKLAVLSNNVFFDGRQVRWRKERWAERRRALQKAGRLSRVKKEAGRERRWMQYINHCLSKRIVEIAKAEGAAIALESLCGIRERAKGSKRFNRMMTGWNFRELASFIEYKAALAGVPVIYVDPKETSITCPRCGNVSRYNREKTHNWFKCTKCGYESDADRVGALNIAAKALDALRACPWEKGECGTPKGQGDPGHPGERWLTCGGNAAIPRWDAPQSIRERMPPFVNIPI
jgi:IS605 OrfB family transposase